MEIMKAMHDVLSSDFYFLGAGHDYKSGLHDWRLVSEGNALPPYTSLGIWYSRYLDYGAESYKSEIVDKYRENGLPLHVGVLDVPWHNVFYDDKDIEPSVPEAYACNGWDGFTVNTTLFPDFSGFIEDMKTVENVSMILSVHMQNGFGHCNSPFYEAMGEKLGRQKDVEEGLTLFCR